MCMFLMKGGGKSIFLMRWGWLEVCFILFMCDGAYNRKIAYSHITAVLGIHRSARTRVHTHTHIQVWRTNNRWTDDPLKNKLISVTQYGCQITTLYLCACVCVRARSSRAKYIYGKYLCIMYRERERRREVFLLGFLFLCVFFVCLPIGLFIVRWDS